MSRNSSSIRRYAGLIFCYSCGALYVVFQGGKVAGMIFGMMNVLLIYLLMGRWSGIRRPQIVQRKLLNSSSEIEAGTVITVALKLKIPGRLPLPYVVVNDQLRHEY